MTSANMVKAAAETLRGKVDEGDWQGADRAVQYLAGAWLRSGVRGADAAAVASVVDGLRIRVVTEHDVDQDVGPREVAWMLAGVSSFLSQAAAPPPLMGRDTADRILEALSRTPEPMTTMELAHHAGRAYATVARELPRLRADGLVSSAGAARTMLNVITPAGRERCSAATRAADVVWPTSIERTEGGPVLAMEPRDIIDPVAVNEVAAIRALI